jgi:hypothetical protein
MASGVLVMPVVAVFELQGGLYSWSVFEFRTAESSETILSAESKR